MLLYLDLIESKNVGILDILNEATQLKLTSEAFTRKVYSVNNKHISLEFSLKNFDSKFAIKHFAGAVTYCTVNN